MGASCIGRAIGVMCIGRAIGTMCIGRAIGVPCIGRAIEVSCIRGATGVSCIIRWAIEVPSPIGTSIAKTNRSLRACYWAYLSKTEWRYHRDTY